MTDDRILMVDPRRRQHSVPLSRVALMAVLRKRYRALNATEKNKLEAWLLANPEDAKAIAADGRRRKSKP